MWLKRILSRSNRTESVAPPIPQLGLEYNPTLLQLSPYEADTFTMKDSFEGVQVFGSTGSGKTSSSGANLARAFLSAGYSGLVLTNKITDKDDWLKYLKQTNRLDDLIVFSPQSSYRFNVLEYERSRSGRGSGLTENLVDLFMVLMEANDEHGGSKSSDQFFNKAVRRLLRNTIDVLMMAGEPLTMRAINQVIATAPLEPALLSDPDWQQTSYCLKLIEKARYSNHSDYKIVESYWLQSFPNEDPRTQSNVIQSLMVMLDLFNRGVLHELFGTTTNLTPELTQQGKIVLIDMPLKEFNVIGKLSQVLVKYIWQQASERRDITKSSRPQFLWVDEAQDFLVSTDSVFQATARASRTATVYLTQSISAYYAKMGSHPNGKAVVDAFLANCGCKVFHCNGDAETNEWAERVIAKNWTYRSHSSSSTQQGQHGSSTHQDSVSSGTNASLESNVLASQFTQLKRGGPANQCLVEALIFQAGRTWAATGKSYLPVTFRQY